ncbi:MAG: type II secretion system protein GspL [Synergistaceae bacterium]|nr:type II secretion system protein GspL [Synergistaceae bacterium]
MSLKDALTKQYSFSDAVNVLRPVRPLGRARLRFVHTEGETELLQGELKVVSVPLRTLSLCSFSFPFGRKVSVRDALELRFRPLLGAGENSLGIVPQITSQKSNETSGTAWFISKAEAEEIEQRFGDCVLWPAPYLFAGRVNGEGVVVCSYEDCSCGMLFVEGEARFYRWIPADEGSAEDLGAQLLEYGKTVFPDRELKIYSVKPDEENFFQQAGDNALAVCKGAAGLNLSSSAASAGGETERLAAKLEAYTDAAIVSAALFLVAAMLLLGINYTGRSRFASAPAEIYKTILGETSANPVASVVQKLRSVSADSSEASFGLYFDRIAAAWETLSAKPQLDELRYSPDRMQLSGKASDTTVIDAFRKVLSDRGFDAVTDSVQKTQKDGMRFTISLTEAKKK